MIANAGGAFQYGWSWPRRELERLADLHAVSIWIFLPYYVRSGIYTMPQFLERRYNSTCRYIFAILAGGGLHRGAPGRNALRRRAGIERIFRACIVGDWQPMTWAILFFAITTGAYTIYGGMNVGRVDGFHPGLPAAHRRRADPGSGPVARRRDRATSCSRCPEKFHVFLPPTHERFPVTGVFTGFLTVGIWYTCTSQHIVQRVLSAKDEWHARMGVVSAGYLRIITPLFFVLPGIIAFDLYPELSRQPTWRISRWSRS